MTEEELANLTPEERSRLEAAEQEALSILRRTVNGGPRPQRHRRFAMLVVVGLLALYFLTLAVGWLVSRI